DVVGGSGTLGSVVWSIRHVMVASNINDTTMVDLSLALVLLFLLGGITLRVLLGLCERNRVRLRRPLRAHPDSRAAGAQIPDGEAAPQPAAVGSGDELPGG